MRPGPKWLPGEVINKLGSLTFLVKLSSGIILKRHINHIRSDCIAEQPQQVISQRLDVPSNSLPVVPAGPVVETPTQPVQENSPSVSSHTEPGPEVTSLPVDAPMEGDIETPMKELSPIEQESPIRNVTLLGTEGHLNISTNHMTLNFYSFLFFLFSFLYV